MMIDESSLRVRFDALRPSLDERRRRLSAAAEAKAAGYGGIAAVARATKVARSTIGRGLKDLRNPGSLTGEVRRKGGGTPRLTVKDPTLLEDLQRLLEPATMGGRVEVWRGGVRPSMSVPAPFVWRCLSGSAVAPFPHPAHRTGRADFPHPALGQDLTPSSRATPSAASEHHLELIGCPISMSFATFCVCLELRSLPSTRVTRFPRYYGPLRHPRAPGLSLTGVQLVLSLLT